MSKGRLEAFSDGVIAILITIMILDLKVPHGSDWNAVRPLVPALLNYVLSFVFLGIYWSNHHHVLHATSRINGGILWANLHLLFWLSLIPFMTAWITDQRFTPLPTALYGVVLLAAALAYSMLLKAIIAEQGPHSKLAAALGRNLKGKTSRFLYTIAIPLAFVDRWISYAIYVVVALMWLIPDRRIERIESKTL
jgi:uncharacterized membrane protein